MTKQQIQIAAEALQRDAQHTGTVELQQLSPDLSTNGRLMSTEQGAGSSGALGRLRGTTCNQLHLITGITHSSLHI